MTDQAATLIQYGQRQGKIPAGTACAGCGSTARTRRATDHCHQHGWVRGIVCPPCNRLMVTIDQMGTPAAISEALLTSLLALRQRCPECPLITPAELAPSLGMAKRRAQLAAEWAAITRMMQGRARLGWGPIPTELIYRQAQIRARAAKVGLRVTEVEPAETRL